jgi:hypothetical protein
MSQNLIPRRPTKKSTYGSYRVRLSRYKDPDLADATPPDLTEDAPYKFKWIFNDTSNRNHGVEKEYYVIKSQEGDKTLYRLRTDKSIPGFENCVRTDSDDRIEFQIVDPRYNDRKLVLQKEGGRRRRRKSRRMKRKTRIYYKCSRKRRSRE